MDRNISKYIQEDLENKKMVFIGGPRQVGKTTLAMDILKSYKKGMYLNFDNPDDRKNIRNRNWNETHEILVFDEIHKWRGWKSWIKGIYDKEKEAHKILVTGSARLDMYRKGGDSLQGRYHYYRLHPISLTELRDHGMVEKNTLQTLFQRGGFPEPYFSASDRNVKRWRKERIDRVIREDVFTLEAIRMISTLELLVELLYERVGSPISLKSLSEDLGISPFTVGSYIRILETMYLVFIVPPYHKNLARAVKKEYKVYFYDWGGVEDRGKRYENMLASFLLKEANFLEDTQGDRVDLYFVKDRDGHETDFLLVKDKKFWKLIEAKLSETDFSKSLAYFNSKIRPEECTQIIYEKTRRKETKVGNVIGIEEYFLTR